MMRRLCLVIVAAAAISGTLQGRAVVSGRAEARPPHPSLTRVGHALRGGPNVSLTRVGRALQGAPNAGTTATRQHVQTLASEQLDGRLTGSAGERLAGDYIVAQLQKIGAKPVPGQTDYRVPFDFTAGSKDGGSTIDLTYAPAGGIESGVVASARALSFSDNGEVSGAVVFAGYGLVVPDSQDFGYDSYAGLDVKDKIVVIQIGRAHV